MARDWRDFTPEVERLINELNRTTELGDSLETVVQAALASDWLAAHDAQVRAEALAPIEALAEEWEADGRTTSAKGGQFAAGYGAGLYGAANDLRAAREAKG
jgi:hypothetical protein